MTNFFEISRDGRGLIKLKQSVIYKKNYNEFLKVKAQRNLNSILHFSFNILTYGLSREKADTRKQSYGVFQRLLRILSHG